MNVRRAVAALAVLVAAAAVGGCGASAPAAEVTTPPPSAVPAPTPSTPGGEPASTLRDFAIQNGPARFPLPADLVISYQVDNPNNVTLMIDVSQGVQTYRFLRDHLAAAGFTITADGQESLTFTGQGWSGAYTVSASVAALTLRTP